MPQKYFDILKRLPRVSLSNIKENPYSKKLKHHDIGRKKKGIKCPYNVIKTPIGEQGDKPFIKLIPTYGFNRDSHLKRQYLPLSLWQLQNMIDLGRIDPSEPIDVNTIANSRCILLDQTEPTCYGIYLVNQGANIFEAKVSIEVQIADELSIAAVERRGGTLTNAFYDRRSFEILCNPVKYFLSGHPIPKRLLPPQDLVPYYNDAKVRGYLSDPAMVHQERKALAEKYGYELPDITTNPNFNSLVMRKDPRQIFFGLEPGSLVSLADEVVIKPSSDFASEHYMQ